MLDRDSTIRLASFGEWLEWASYYTDRPARHLAERQKYPDKPFSVWVEGYEPYLDEGDRRLWQRVGPRDGECRDWQHEWPACPLVRAIPENPDTHSYDYRNPGEHSHAGDWVGLGCGKSAYDGFYVEYRFRYKDDADWFRSIVPGLQLPEEFDQ